MKKYLIIILCLAIILNGCSKKENKEDNFWWISDKTTGINISQVWEKTHGSDEILIGIIDSGIDISCDGISSAVYTNQKEIPNNGIDDDNNGYIDDINGWNFYDDSNEVYTAYTSDYHGTMIAGVLADKTYGVAPQITYLPLKCFRGTEGSIEDVTNAIQYGYNLGVRLFNCSWDTEQYNEELFNTIQKYSDAIFVCSGGKNSEDLDVMPVYPACYDLPNVICVGGIDKSGALYEYSGYGEKIDTYAPSAEIYCLMPENTYCYSEGTSLATAFVTGAIALAQSVQSSISCEDIKKILDNSYNDKLKLKELNVQKLCLEN